MDSETIKPLLGLIARHALTTAAGILASHGYLQSSGTEQFVGAGLLFLGVAWSWWQKSGQAAVLTHLAKLRSVASSATLAAAARAPEPTAADKSSAKEAASTAAVVAAPTGGK